MKQAGKGKRLTSRNTLRDLCKHGDDIAMPTCAIADYLGLQATVLEHAKAEIPEPPNVDAERLLYEQYARSGTPEMIAAATVVAANIDQDQQTKHQQAVDMMLRMEAGSRRIDEDTPGFKAPRKHTRFGSASGPNSKNMMPPGSRDSLSLPPSAGLDLSDPNLNPPVLSGASGDAGPPLLSGGGSGSSGSSLSPGGTSGVGGGGASTALGSGGSSTAGSNSRMARVPMGGGAGARGQGGEDDEHRSPDYLKDQSLFEVDERPAPPVIGEKFKKKEQ